MAITQNLSEKDIKFLKALKSQGVGAEEALTRLQKVKSQIQSQQTPSSPPVMPAKEVKNMLQSGYMPQGKSLKSGGSLSGLEEGKPFLGGLLESSFEKSIRENTNIDNYQKESMLNQAKNPLVKVGENTLEAAKQGKDQIVEGLGTTIKGVNPFDGQQSVQDRARNVWRGLTRTTGGALGTVFSPISGAVESLPTPIKNPVQWGLNLPNEAIMAGVKGVGSLAGADVNSEDFYRDFVEPAQIAGTVLGAKYAKPISKVAKNTVKGVGKTLNFLKEEAISKSTGMGKDTRIELRDNPFIKAAEKGDLTRESLSGEVLSNIDRFLKENSEIGNKYKPLRDKRVPVDLGKNWFGNELNRLGLKFEKGKLKATAESEIRNKADVAAIQDLYSKYGNNKLNSNTFLNLRKDLAELADFGNFASDSMQAWARSFRKQLNKEGIKQIKGLKELDSSLAPRLEAAKKFKKEFVTQDFQGNTTLKDTAISRIANITGKGKEKSLQRLKEILPEVDKKAKALKALDDVLAASEKKVGNYTKGILDSVSSGGVGLGVLTGNPLMAGGSLVYKAATNPQTVSKILQGYGKIKNTQKVQLPKIPNLNLVKNALKFAPSMQLNNQST